MHLIADETLFFESPYPEGVFCFTPALCHGFDGRIVAGFDLGGPGTEKLEGPRSDFGDHPTGNQVRIFLSDDHGGSWRESRTRLPMWHGIFFKAGKYLYVLGQSGRLLISRSSDNGESWSSPAVLEQEFKWHQSAGRVDCRHAKVYAVYEKRIPGAPWPGVAPVLMSADEEADLCDPVSWTFSEAFDPRPLFPDGNYEGGEFGVLESSLIRLYDPEHRLYDPEDRTLYLLMRAQTGIGNLAGLLKGVERKDGSLAIEPVILPGGKIPLFLIPFPGGQMKFHADYDPVSKLYWMVGTHAIDSYALHPVHCGERKRLELFYSRNGFEYRSAGLAAVATEGPTASRHYASLLFDGDDLLILSRSGDDRSPNAHDGNWLTLHRVKNFRSLTDL